MESSAFDLWATQAQLPNSQPLQDIGHDSEGPCIGIDAIYFLEELQIPQKGFLAPLLGGFPRSTEQQIFNQIKALKSVGCTVYFFFNGLDTNFDEGSPAASSIAQTQGARVPDAKANDQSRVSGGLDNSWYCACLKSILRRSAVPFVVAPFKAHAQMVHALQEGAVDALYGPSDLFLSGASKVITKMRLHYDSNNSSDEESLNAEQSKVVWLELDQCLKMLGDVPLELFQDAMYLVGNRSLEPFPPLRDPLDPQVSFKEVVGSLNQIGGNILQFCERYPPAIRGNWLDRYMRAHQAIKHMVILYDYTTVKPRTHQNAQRVDRPPSDIHELVGLQLPAELHHYLYHGMISPRVLNWLISGKIKISQPLAGGDSEAYRKLVRDQLDPWRKQALALLAYILSHYWQRKEIVTHLWFGPEGDQKFSMRELTSDKSRISTWRVKEQLLNQRLEALQINHKTVALGGLQFAVLSLADTTFAAKTISPARRPNTEKQLLSSEEITCNILWRLLQLRGYANDKHELTPWGKFLQAAFEKVSPTNEQAQSIFVIVELLRLGLLDNSQATFKDQASLSKLGADPSDKLNALMILYLACTGEAQVWQRNTNVSSTAHILTYHAIVTEITLALRDLIDMILATMFLDDEVERVRDDELEIAASLPFQQQWSAGLAIVTASGFEELAATNDPTDKKGQQPVLQAVFKQFGDSNVYGCIKGVGTLWDAFNAAIQAAPSDLVAPGQKTFWSSVGAWFTARRLG